MKVAHALATTLVVSLAAAAPASAQSLGRSGDPLLDFRSVASRYGPPLTCDAVPTVHGTTAPLGMVVTSDSSRKVATVEYVIYVGPWDSPDGQEALVPVADGRVTVVRGTHYTAGPTLEVRTAERRGASTQRSDACRYSNPSQWGQADVVHLRPVKRSLANALQSWCTKQPWYTEAPQECPLDLVAGT
ncbi:hypothetical protein GTQ99_01390 [Kineococcus sp. T13]|uniref:hypothetical protein n=1 Tax=Kineococcus vitellinus TaxID=2696565 RepID=UPI001411B961|nr:hypothetical protein [Kineococcus vitellinus]NAZ74085.1 hypothetical protein [Kineococcus vitellinus]